MRAISTGRAHAAVRHVPLGRFDIECSTRYIPKPMITHRLRRRVVIRATAITTSVIGIVSLGASAASATPQFARTYRVDCSHCHSLPPRLNERGLAFVAAGYRFVDPDLERYRTLPLAIWNTVDAEWRHSVDIRKGYASRVELISAGAIDTTRASYFAEWRALSQSVAANGRLLNRSGRFEDLFLRVPVGLGGTMAATVGQFRGLTQVDVSLRLGLSEPLVFSSSLPATTAASRARLTSLRGFSASGRQPAARLEYQQGAGRGTADGWFAAVTVPLTGELTIPFTDAASFELEARPKGVLLETYRRWGLTSVGGHTFLGDRRRLGTFVVTHDIARRLALVGGIGVFHRAGSTDTRFSAGSEVTLSPNLAAGIRLDHRTAQRLDPLVLIYGNGHLPLGPAVFRQALRLQIEQRVQSGNHVSTIALSHVF